MIAYAVIIEDRHSNPQVEVFAEKDAAVEWAKAWSKKMLDGYLESTTHMMDYSIGYPDADEELDAMPEGWHYYCSYSSEGDCLYVSEVPFHEES